MKKILSLFAFILSFNLLFAQSYRQDILKFKSQDSISFPKPNSILFVGSSSFTKWTFLNESFPNYPVFNRGFGGSTLLDVIYYSPDIILPYHPKQIVIYCGENDIASSDTVTANIVLERFKKLFFIIRSKMPRVEIDYVSIKPSPSRAKFQPTIKEANRLIEKFINYYLHTKFINVYDDMLNKDGSMRKDLFVEDNLHMNKAGYAIWTKIIEPYLKK